jgi:hypothetical protein
MNIASISSGVASQTLASSSTQEATETLAQTKLEAAKGDQQAIQKLARLQAQQSQKSGDTDGDQDGSTGKAGSGTSLALDTQA